MNLNKRPEIGYGEKKGFTNHNKQISDLQAYRYWRLVGSADFSMSAYKELAKRDLNKQIGDLEFAD